MSETLQPPLYQTEPDERTSAPEKPVQPNSRFASHATRGNALAVLLGYFITSKPAHGAPADASAPHGEMSEADAVNLLGSHRLPGSDLLPFLDSTASPPPAMPGTPASARPGSLWARWRRAIAAWLCRSRAHS